MSGDADSWAEIVERTAGAPGRGRVASVLAEGDEQIVDVDPEILRQDRLERLLRRVGVFRRHHSEAVGYAVDVSVDADGRDAEAQPENEIGGFASDPGKLEQRRLVPRDLAAVILDEESPDLPQLSGLRVVKTGGVDGARDRFQVEGGELGRGVGQPEEASTGVVGHLVLGSQGDHARHQQVKRRSGRALNLGQSCHPAGCSKSSQPFLEIPDLINLPQRSLGFGWFDRHRSMMSGGRNGVKLLTATEIAMRSH